MATRTNSRRCVLCFLFLTLLLVIVDFLEFPYRYRHTTTTTTKVSCTNRTYYKALVESAQKQVEDEYPFANETALVMRTLAPIRGVVLDRIYQLAVENHQRQSNYDFWLLVDETKNQNSQERLETYFARHGGAARGEVLATLRPPRIFAVSETSLLARYPNLTSYIYNKPETNVNNEMGVCCAKPIMWQMFIPTFGMFMESHPQYRYGWTFEDDFAVVGARSHFDLFRKWDWQLMNKTADLVAPLVEGERWGKVRHTQNMEVIVQAMQDASVKWRIYSDTVQRHSQSLAQSIVTEVGNNVMQFGERLVHPIAWKHNHTIVNLDQLSLLTENNSSMRTVFGLDALTPGGDVFKRTYCEGAERWLNLSESLEQPVTFVFHELQ